MRSRVFDHDLVRRTGVSPNLPYSCICGSSGCAIVKIRPPNSCNYPNLRSFGWVSYGLPKVGVLYTGKLGNKSEARASDLRRQPGLGRNRRKLRLQRLRKWVVFEDLLNWYLQGTLCVSAQQPYNPQMVNPLWSSHIARICIC